MTREEVLSQCHSTSRTGCGAQGCYSFLVVLILKQGLASDRVSSCLVFPSGITGKQPHSAEDQKECSSLAKPGCTQLRGLIFREEPSKSANTLFPLQGTEQTQGTPKFFPGFLSFRKYCFRDRLSPFPGHK